GRRPRRKVARGAEHQRAKTGDAQVGRPKHLAGAVVDAALTVLNGGVLLGDALDAGETLALLQISVVQIVVGPPPDRRVLVVDLGVDGAAPGVGRPPPLAPG